MLEFIRETVIKHQTAGNSGVAQKALLRLSGAVENATYLFGCDDGARVQQAVSRLSPNGLDVSVAASCGSDGRSISSAASCGGAPAIPLAASCGSDGQTVRSVAFCGSDGILPGPGK